LARRIPATGRAVALIQLAGRDLATREHVDVALPIGALLDPSVLDR
jgi:hypothetical protein